MKSALRLGCGVDFLSHNIDFFVVNCYYWRLEVVVFEMVVFIGLIAVICALVLLSAVLLGKLMLARRALVLALLRENKDWMHGLELIKLSRGGLSRGILYVTLSRLEDEHLVERKVVKDGGPAGNQRFLYRYIGS